jgi:hypothetical protein
MLKSLTNDSQERIAASTRPTTPMPHGQVVPLPLMGLWARILPESMIDKRHRRVCL